MTSCIRLSEPKGFFQIACLGNDTRTLYGARNLVPVYYKKVSCRGICERQFPDCQGSMCDAQPLIADSWRLRKQRTQRGNRRGALS